MLISRGYANITIKFDILLAEIQNWCFPVFSQSFGINLGESIHRHHIVERRLGWKEVISNLIVVHWPCNLKIHHDKNKRKWI